MVYGSKLQISIFDSFLLIRVICEIKLIIMWKKDCFRKNKCANHTNPFFDMLKTTKIGRKILKFANDRCVNWAYFCQVFSVFWGKAYSCRMVLPARIFTDLPTWKRSPIFWVFYWHFIERAKQLWEYGCCKPPSY